MTVLSREKNASDAMEIKPLWIAAAAVLVCVAVSYSTWIRLVMGVPDMRAVRGMVHGDAVAVLRGNSALRSVEILVVRDGGSEVSASRASTIVLFVDVMGFVQRSEFVPARSTVKHGGVVMST